MKTVNECLVCGTMTGNTDRLCGDVCLEAMYDALRIETPTCSEVGCTNDATHDVQGVGDTMASICESCCDGCDECPYRCDVDECDGRVMAHYSHTGKNVWDACNTCGKEY